MRRIFTIMCSLFILVLLGSIPHTEAAFSDLPENHRHYFPLSYLEFEGIVGGYDDGTVRPGAFINRAELMKILVEGLGFSPDEKQYNNCFPDVKNEWFARYICFALEKGWIEGYPDGTFKPGQNVNKAEALKIILNAYGIAIISPSEALLFSDVPSTEWFAPYVAVAVQKILLEEIGADTFAAGNVRNRGEIAEFVARILMIQAVGDEVYTPWLRAEFQNYLYIHELRRQEGITDKLTINKSLTKVAREHARDMGDNIKGLSHGSSDGITQSFDRIKKIIREEDDPNFGGRTGENLGGGSDWAKDPFDAIKWVHDNIFMLEDPNVCNHRTSLLSQCLPYTEIGIGVYVNPEGQTYFVNDFITRVYADTMEMRVGLALPSEYSNTAQYSIVDQEETYVTTLTNNCSAARVRNQYFIEVGVYVDNGNCKVYEHAWSRQPQWSVLRGYLEDQIFAIEYTSTYYTAERPSENPEFIAIRPQLTSGWEIVGHENPNLPAYYDVGETATISFRNKNSGTEHRFQLKFTEGWAEVTML